MQPLEFCFWLQGMFEIGNPTTLDANQVSVIKDHLKLVFNKVTPERSAPVLKDVMDSSVCSGKSVVATTPNLHQTFCASDPRTRRICGTTVELKPTDMKSLTDLVITQQSIDDVSMSTYINMMELHDLYSKEKLCKYFDGPQPSC